MKPLNAGDQLPNIVVPPPGPHSRRLAARLVRVESRHVTAIGHDFPIFWRDALGANVLDVDGNVYIDLTAGFAVAAAGHRNPRVVDAVKRQLDSLAHGMGDVHPPEIKVRLLERLAEIAPGDLSQTILSSSGSEAVEAALKTARLATGKPGVLCFGRAYHGLTYGALAVTDGDLFRAPFIDQLGIPAVRVPFPDPYRPSPDLQGLGDLLDAALEVAARRLDPDGSVGAVIVEPILGRGGIVVPPVGFLRGLRRLCDERGLVLIFDEVYTGFGRTGRWFACQHEDVVPDLLCIGKALTGALPFSACIGRPEIMSAWPPSRGEAMHTSTFIGHPLGCAAALAQIEEIEGQRLVERAQRLGERVMGRLRDIQTRCPSVGDVRGRGLLVGIEIVRDPASRAPDPERTAELVTGALQRGVILLAGGHILELSPPLTISESQLDAALDVLEGLLVAA
ncbi:MAG TPA: aspartate aminotransferase family protein [Gemmatimonadota bacterium]|nr:aspartate aminotransferase family protein [Gemmatimonadota bacterium]